MSPVSYLEPSLKDRIISNFLGVVVISILIFSGFFILEQMGVLVWLIIVIAAIGLLVFWHSQTRAYKCKSCGNEFQISFWKDLLTLSAYFFRQKMLTCPECDNKDYASELVKRRT